MTTIIEPPLALRRQRGRPKTASLARDSGTPELVMKRLLGETAEAIDLCLERGLISHQQHWCGIHLRWLYTLRYGAPGVRAIDPTHLGGIETGSDDPDWRGAREKEYHEAMKKLGDGGHAVMITDICIHNERPKFLVTRKLSMQNSHLIIDLRDGLDILIRHWKR